MVVGISRTLNEVDIAAPSVEWMLTQVDRLIIGLGPSDDGTSEVIRDLARENPITVHDDYAKNFEQAGVMTTYAHEAREMGATFVIPYDTDEVWAADEGTIAEALTALDPAILLAPARLVQHTCTTRDDEAELNPFKRMQWRETQMLPLVKVACRTHPELVIDHGNHSARYDGVRRPPAALGVLQARHYSYRDPEQFVKRVKGAYPQLKNSGLPRTHGQHMWEYGECLEREGEDGLRRLFAEHMVQNPDAEPGKLVHDPAPCALES